MLAAESVLLRRIQTVYVDAGPGAGTGTGRGGDPGSGTGPGGAHRAGPALRRLEAELLGRGCTLSPALHAALSALPGGELAATHTRVVALADRLMGSDRTHNPLFREFPRTVPRDTEALYVDRVFAHLLQQPDQPCVLCGEGRTVHAVSPCAHLVCRLCWDGADYSGCPLCHRRLDGDDPFLRPVRAVGAAKPPTTGPLRLLRLGTDRAADATAIVGALLARRTPLSPQDRHDLLTLLPLSPAGRGLLPEDIPVRETKALVIGTLLGRPPAGAEEAVRALPAERLTTATDVLRVLSVLSGGSAGLLPLPQFIGPHRALRRLLLAVLDGLPTPFLVEDLLRHPTAWKRAAEPLHPFEQHARHPRAALAFAVLRETRVDAGTSFGAALLETAADHPDAVRVVGDRIRPATWAGRMERALAAGDPGPAAALAGERPGELVRRLDHLLRLHPADADAPVPELAEALARGLPRVGPGPLLSALGALRVRAEDRTGRRRVFFPRAEVTRALALREVRPPLPAALTGAVVRVLEAEVLRRFAGGAGEPYELAVLDPELGDLAVPFAEHGAAASLVAVPRGSMQSLPSGEVVRLFLHWREPEGRRTDLDLSVAFFDADWRFTGLCDYTSLTHGRGAVHSGDLTSAPAPDGATEYVDLDPAVLARDGDAYAVPMVFSFNNVAFEELPDAFAGFMALPAGVPRDAGYHPRAVRRRFDLVGDSSVTLPMVVDLAAGRALWADVHLPPAEGFQSVRSQGPRLGRVARDLWEQYGSGTRATLWDLTVWRAAVRAREVAVVRRAGPDDGSGPTGGSDELWLYRRGPGEEPGAFAARIAGPVAAGGTGGTGAADEAGADGAAGGPDERLAVPDARAAAAELASGRRVFLATVDAGVAPARATGTSYRLFPGPGDAAEALVRVTAADLVAELG
ncbi:MXAN_6230/SCO0854 family RING domain-containing protein [Streptomyces sp. NPDC012888]|uniref:MXAN_6230/SCO0854 family RING domain-containing protein n=1 Tax=Streptomyces sp. NPDC012888 TaxID=3364855 RepID=UPI0036CDB506